MACYRSGAYIPPTVNYDYIANKLPEKEDTLHVEVFLRCHIHRLVVLQPGTEYRMIYDFRDIGLLEHESCKDWSFQFTVEYYDPKVDHTMAQVTSDQVVIEGLPLDAFAREELKKEHFQVSDSHQWGHVANGYALSLNSPKRNYLISEEIEIAVVTKNICSKRTYLRRTDGELTSLPFRLTITKPNGEMVRFHRDLKTERMDYPLCIRDEVDYFESYIRRVRPHVHDQRIAPGVLLKSQGNLNDIASHFSEKGRYKLSVSAQVGRDENEEPIFTESNEVELIVGV